MWGLKIMNLFIWNIFYFIHKQLFTSLCIFIVKFCGRLVTFCINSWIYGIIICVTCIVKYRFFIWRNIQWIWVLFLSLRIIFPRCLYWILITIKSLRLIIFFQIRWLKMNLSKHWLLRCAFRNLARRDIKNYIFITW